MALREITCLPWAGAPTGNHVGTWASRNTAPTEITQPFKPPGPPGTQHSRGNHVRLQGPRAPRVYVGPHGEHGTLQPTGTQGDHGKSRAPLRGNHVPQEIKPHVVTGLRQPRAGITCSHGVSRKHGPRGNTQHPGITCSPGGNHGSCRPPGNHAAPVVLGLTYAGPQGEISWALAPTGEITARRRKHVHSREITCFSPGKSRKSPMEITWPEIVGKSRVPTSRKQPGEITWALAPRGNHTAPRKSRGN